MSSMDHPAQNKDKIRDTHQLSNLLEPQKSGIKPMERENHHDHHCHEEQSKVSVFQRCENHGKEEKLETTHEEIIDLEKKQQPLSGIEAIMKERESEPIERLKRYRTEVAGKVWIPEMWGQEDFLKDWIDCSAFDSCLVTHQDIISARASLVQEARRTSSGRLEVQNSC